MVIWLTGLSGSGKTTLSKSLKTKLKKLTDKKVILLDGDTVRELGNNCDFSKEGRIRHVMAVCKVAARQESHGHIVICALISPFLSVRERVRSICKNFIEIYISTPLEVCANRDVKGLYQKVKDGKIKNFTGIDSPYEPPIRPEITIDTTSLSIEEATQIITNYLIHHGEI